MCYRVGLESCFILVLDGWRCVVFFFRFGFLWYIGKNVVFIFWGNVDLMVLILDIVYKVISGIEYDKYFS